MVALKQSRKFSFKNILKFNFGSNHLMASNTTKIHGRRYAGSSVKTKKLEMNVLKSSTSLLDRSISEFMKKWKLRTI